MKYLLEDITSYYGQLYGKKGTEVAIIRECENVTLVVDEKGFAFPVLTKYLSDKKPLCQNLEKSQ